MPRQNGSENANFQRKGDKSMKGVQLTKMVQELELNNLTPEIDLSGIVIKTAEINRPALQLTGYLEHFANERVQIIGYVEWKQRMPGAVCFRNRNCPHGKKRACGIQ